MKLLIATDAWRPQVNGVVRTIERICEEMPYFGVDVSMITPSEFRTLPTPTYPEIRLALCTQGAIRRRIEKIKPDAIHIATEGPIGFQVRRWCIRNKRPFNTCYHTRFPEYVAARAPIPLSLSYALVRNFHNAGKACMVATETLEKTLAARGFTNLVHWSRGVDSDLFRPRPEEPPLDLPRPIFTYVGRVAVEKNIGAFLDLDLPGSKMVVGDGPELASLKKAHPEVRFTGYLTGEDLAKAYAASDVFVFPSRTDTFGMVLLEALASGVPVAAYPVTGPADVIGTSEVGVLDEDLRSAALRALDIPGERCRAFVLGQTWRGCAREFLRNVIKADPAMAALLPSDVRQ